MPFFLGIWAWGKANRLLATLGLIVALVVALWIGWQVAKIIGARQEAARQDAIAAAGREAATARNSAALEQSATQRAADVATVDQLNKELTDAVQGLPDSRPSPRRVALGCARLRAAGKDVSGLPECRRP